MFDKGAVGDQTEVLQYVKPLISEKINSNLTANFTIEEVKEAVFQLGAVKALGPDGFSSTFYHSYWDVVGNDICQVVFHFFQTCQMPQAVNFTEIVLIPKIKVLRTYPNFDTLVCVIFCIKSFPRSLSIG